MTKEQIHAFLIDNILNKLVDYTMEDLNCDMLTAMKVVYSSPVVSWLQNIDDDLCAQSPAYVYELMKRYQ